MAKQINLTQLNWHFLSLPCQPHIGLDFCNRGMRVFFDCFKTKWCITGSSSKQHGCSGRDAIALAFVLLCQINYLQRHCHSEGWRITIALLCLVRRTGDDKNILNYHLLTTEPVQSKVHTLNMIRFYEHRWFIEECHKVRTTEGADIEIARSESMDNIEQPVIISVFYCYKNSGTQLYLRQDTRGGFWAGAVPKNLEVVFEKTGT